MHQLMTTRVKCFSVLTLPANSICVLISEGRVFPSPRKPSSQLLADEHLQNLAHSEMPLTMASAADLVYMVPQQQVV